MRGTVHDLLHGERDDLARLEVLGRRPKQEAVGREVGRGGDDGAVAVFEVALRVAVFDDHVELRQQVARSEWSGRRCLSRWCGARNGSCAPGK